MEGAKQKPSVATTGASSSFRLRSSSLNSLRLRRVFDIFDGNLDGEITVDELCGALDRLGLGADASEISSTISSFIRPGHAGLEFEDFKNLHQSLGDTFFGSDNSVDDVMADDELLEAFKVFDENGDGFISAMELQVVLSKLGFPEGTEISRVEDMICSVDRNNDGRVDFDEFKIMMRRIVPVPIC